MFERPGETFVPYGAGKSILATVNKTAALVYAPAVTVDELELFFTAASPAEGQTCTVVTPAHAAGIADVRATVAGKTSPKATADQYLYE